MTKRRKRSEPKRTSKPKSKTDSRPDKLEMMDRIVWVQEQMCEWMSSRALVVAIMEKYGVGTRMAQMYIQRAYEDWEAEEKEERRYRREQQRRRLLKLCIRYQDDPRAVVQLETLLARIDGTFAPERVEVVEFDPQKLSDEQLERIAGGEDPGVVLAAGAVH